MTLLVYYLYKDLIYSVNPRCFTIKQFAYDCSLGQIHISLVTILLIYPVVMVELIH